MSNTCILYVEDEDNDVFLLQNGFKREGITNPLQVATDGQMAMATWLAQDRLPTARNIHCPAWCCST